MSFSPEYLMRLALKKAKQGVEEGQTPFGACIVREGSILSCEHNQVWKLGDITAHAEILAIREACRSFRSIDLSGCVIYSTCEPCPMCFSAIHWAKISKIVFGARIEDAQQIGFSELVLSNQKMKELTGSSIELLGDFLREEVVGLFQEWSHSKKKRVY